jgi:glycosyltransferase involved in cell wall biosynthesis
MIIFAAKAFLHLLLHKEYEIVFLHGVAGFDSLLFPLAKLLRRKTILELTLVNTDDPVTLKKRKCGFIFLLAISCAGAIIAISTKLKELSLQAGVKPSKIKLIPVGVNTGKFYKLDYDKKKILREKLTLDIFEKVFIAVGRIEERKNYSFMIKAWKIIEEVVPGAVLLITGPGNENSNKYFTDLQREIKHLQIKNIRFLGLIDNVSEYMQMSDFLLHCSLNEGLPNVLLEAALTEVFIICRRMEGITSDIIINSDVGVESMSNTPEEFAKEALFIINNKAKKGEVRNDFIVLKEKFDINFIANRYLNLFNELLEKSPKC